MNLRPFYDFEWWEEFSLAGIDTQIGMLTEAVMEDCEVSPKEESELRCYRFLSYSGECIVSLPFALEPRHLSVLFIEHKVFAIKPDDRSLLWLIKLSGHEAACFVLTDGQDWPELVLQEGEKFAAKYPFIAKWHSLVWDTDKILLGGDAVKKYLKAISEGAP